MIGVAVVGLGRWGPHLARVFAASTGARLVGLVDVSPNRRKAIAEVYPGVEISESLAPVLEDHSVDAVVLATPASTHHELGLQTLQAEKHLLVEKPLATTADDATELVELAKGLQKVLMVGHVFLYNPSFIKAQKLIREGAIGDLLYLSMRRTNLGPRRSDTSVVWDLAVHDVAIANAWTKKTPIEVTAAGISLYPDQQTDLVFATLTYPSDVLMHVHASWVDPKKTRFLTAVGTKGMITVDDLEEFEPVRVYDSRIEAEEIRPSVSGTFAEFEFAVRGESVSIPLIPATEPLEVERDEFLSRVNRGVDSGFGAKEGLEVVRVLEAIDQSISRKTTIGLVDANS